VDASKGQWQPNEITLKAGIPAVLTFGEGQGCLAQVVFPDLGITKDLTAGGASVDVPALEPGEYSFACGMNMVFGKLVVR
jgi:Cu+-exporting ATPase